MYELFELDLFVLVGVSTEHVPEHIVQLSLSCLFQNIDNESFKLIPDSVDKTELFLTDVLRNFFTVFRLAPEIDVITKVLSYEVDVLLESDVTVVISVKFFEDSFKISLRDLIAEEVAVSSKDDFEFSKTDLTIFP